MKKMNWFKKKRIERAVKRFYEMYGEKSEHGFKVGFHEKIFNQASDALTFGFNLQRHEANQFLHDFNKKMTMQLLDQAFAVAKNGYFDQANKMLLMLSRGECELKIVEVEK